ncbi:MAG TPA: hypothetical protein VN838_11365 [Bradyrhizobium sp.]|nr:hypothetical protein [Bradyrhizobium sp.]
MIKATTAAPARPAHTRNPRPPQSVRPGETNCPALAIARLIGIAGDQVERFQHLELAAKEESRSDFTRGWKAASATVDLGLKALALAPVTSLEGAVAKILAAHHAIVVLADFEVDRSQVNEAEFYSFMLMQDVMAYFERSHSITAASIGMGYVYAAHLEPRAVLAAAETAATKPC